MSNIVLSFQVGKEHNATEWKNRRAAAHVALRMFIGQALASQLPFLAIGNWLVCYYSRHLIA